MDKLIDKSQKYILYAIIFLLPLVFAPISPNPFVPAKLAVLVFGVGILLVIKSAKSILDGKITWSVGKYDFPLLLLAVAYVASAYLRTPNKMEAVFLPGTASIVAGGALLYFLINQLSNAQKKTAAMVLIASGVLSAISSLISATGALQNASSLPNYMTLTVFTPAAGHLPSAIFLATLLPISLSMILSEKIAMRKIMISIGAGLIALGLAASIYSLFPGQPAALRLPSYNVGWGIAVDSLKESPLLGIGPGNYLTAFNRFRPITFNNTDLWALKFATARSFYLSAITETGMLGVAAIILLLFSVYKYAKTLLNNKKYMGLELANSGYLASAILLLVILALLPASMFVIVLLFIILAFSSQTKDTVMNLSSQSPLGTANSNNSIGSRVPAIIVTLPIIGFVIFISFRALIMLRAEYNYKLALDAIGRNDAITTYNTLRNDVIAVNPLVDRYHASYSQINLALANSLASQVASNSTATEGEGTTAQDISEEDRAQITQLVQQAIREARATVTLNPTRAGNWELLGRTYQAIIPLAQGADVFASQSFTQAIALDPTNPNLRIALGGIHYAAGDYTNAVNIFNRAVLTKRDLANSHYNLAFALKEAGSIDAAKEAMKNVLSIVDRDSQDYETARKALEDLESLSPTVEAAPGSANLVPPQEAQEQILQPPVELGEEDQPPTAPISPTPTPVSVDKEPTVTPEATPTPTIAP